MKSMFTKTFALLAVAASLSACAGMTQTQRNTATGAVIGGVAGNLIGGDTGSTLGGAALGGVIGSQVHRHRLSVCSLRIYSVRPSETEFSDGLNVFFFSDPLLIQPANSSWL